MPSADEHVLLLHGQPGSARDWDRVRAAIGARAHALAFDRPGWDGGSPPTDLVGNAQAAVSVLDAHEIERATVVGHSLGGAVAAWLASQHPDRVAALVLVAPSANVASLNLLDALLAAPVMGPLLGATTFAGIGAALAAPPLRHRIAGQLGVEDRYLRRYGRVLLTPATWGAFAAEQRMLVRDLGQLEHRLARISAPATIVIGTADRIVTPASARELATQIAGAELVWLEHASHLLLQERPAEVAEIIVAAARRASS